MNFNWDLGNGYVVRSMSADEFDPLFQKHAKQIFDDDTQVFRLRDALTESERGHIKKLGQCFNDIFWLTLGVFKGDEFVGWHLGRQNSAYSFYMQNSAILPEHRRKGLYTQLTKKVVEAVSEMGFQDIWSRHVTTNNDVIIPKLKQGFVITSIEVTDIFGVLVHLHYYPNKVRKKMMNYRVGQIKPDKEIKELLDI